MERKRNKPLYFTSDLWRMIFSFLMPLHSKNDLFRIICIYETYYNDDTITRDPWKLNEVLYTIGSFNVIAQSRPHRFIELILIERPLNAIGSKVVFVNVPVRLPYMNSVENEDFMDSYSRMVQIARGCYYLHHGKVIVRNLNILKNHIILESGVELTAFQRSQFMGQKEMKIESQMLLARKKLFYSYSWLLHCLLVKINLYDPPFSLVKSFYCCFKEDLVNYSVTMYSTFRTP
jgi:hypothetical protein